jgi:MSHA biogenesis protein MshL
MNRIVLAGFVVVLSGCSVPMLPRDTSVQNTISTDLQQAAAPRPRAEPPTISSSVSNSLLPPLRATPPRASARELEQRFNLRVTDAPIGQVLQAIVQDTPYSILLSPRLAPPMVPVAGGPVGTAPTAMPELLTVNLKDVTVFEALEAVREIYGYEYTVDGTRIYVQPPEMRTKLYQVNYVLGQRRGVSDVQVIGGASASNNSNNSGGTNTGVTSGTGNSNASSGYASIQASAMSSIAKADVWGEMEDAARTVLGCQIGRAVATSRTGGTTASASPGGSSGNSANSTRADVSFVGEMQVMERLRGGEGCVGGRALTVNAMSGTLVVRGLPHELRQIEQLLRSLQLSIERQVIIEAKIIDVELNQGSQQGINWSLLRHGAFRGGVGADPFFVDATNSATRGQIPAGTTLGDIVGSQLLGVATANAFSAGLGIAFQTGNFSALLNFLETQGTVHVLSSPRISTLNNQKAVLKVGSEEPFVTSVSGGTAPTISGGVVVPGTAPNISYQPFFAGISLDVTPQVDENDNVTLHVRSMVNSIIEREKIALLTTSTRVPFAVNNISETDSVVKTRDGQVVVIGGLMTESSNDTRQRVPVAGDVPVVGALFGRSNRSSNKRELVILLKPTVVKGDEKWAGDVSATQGRIERMNLGVPRPYGQ